MFFKRKEITETQHLVIYKNNQIDSIMCSGSFQQWDFKNEITFSVYDTNELYCSIENIARLYKTNALLAEHIQHEKITDTQVGLLYVDDKLKGIVPPGEHLYLWKNSGDIHLELISIEKDIEVDDKTRMLINRCGANSTAKLIKSLDSKSIIPIKEINIANNHVGILYINAVQVRTLTSGLYGFWQFNHQIEIKTYDTRSKILDISGQEILSKDRVSLRINLTATYHISDALLTSQSIEHEADYIYKILQLALREAVGTKTLDDILIDKLYINQTVNALVFEKLTEIGITLTNVGVKDIILPGEMKTILNQVVEAQKSAEANVIKRREETSATRSLSNTAKVTENNPILLRLKELEALEKIAEKIDSLNIYNGVEGLMNDVIKLK